MKSNLRHIHSSDSTKRGLGAIIHLGDSVYRLQFKAAERRRTKGEPDEN
jgi:hypothetical protein